MIRGFAAIGLISPKAEVNVGGAVRAAFCYGAAFVAVQGQRYRHQRTDPAKASRHLLLYDRLAKQRRAA